MGNQELFTTSQIRWRYAEPGLGFGIKGKLVLTENELIFEAKEIKNQIYNVTIPYEDMAQIALIQNGGLLQLVLKNGESIRFCVYLGISKNKTICNIIAGKIY